MADARRRIVPVSAADTEVWLLLRRQLWPHCAEAEHRAEMARFLADPSAYAQFLCLNSDGEPLGFAEGSVRRDYVNGTETSPLAYLEGLFVAAHARRQGIARQLVDAVADWAVARGLSELASDADLSNTISHATHRALGFEETERAVFFRRRLTAPPHDPLRRPKPASAGAVIEVRTAGPDDLPSVLAIDELVRSNDARSARIRLWLDQAACVVAVDAAGVVGYGVLEHSFFGHGFIAMIYVAAPARRQGVGTALLRELERRCTTPKLFTSTNQSNAAMQHLLAKAGFRQSGVIHDLDPGDPELVYVRAAG